VPVGGLAQVADDAVSITGMIASLDGQLMFRDTIEGSARDAEILGLQLAEKLLAAGAKRILREICKM
jgi:hydroxymethylbilane synthase